MLERFCFVSSDPPTFSLTRLPSSSLLEEGTSVTFLFKPTTHGNPRSYDFLECNHTADGRYLRLMPYTNNTQHQIQFVIKNVSFTDRGSYTCGVTNGIQDRSGNSVIKGSRNLDLKSMLTVSSFLFHEGWLSDLEMLMFRKHLIILFKMTENISELYLVTWLKNTWWKYLIIFFF